MSSWRVSVVGSAVVFAFFVMSGTGGSGGGCGPLGLKLSRVEAGLKDRRACCLVLGRLRGGGPSSGSASSSWTGVLHLLVGVAVCWLFLRVDEDVTFALPFERAPAELLVGVP